MGNITLENRKSFAQDFSPDHGLHLFDDNKTPPLYIYIYIYIYIYTQIHRDPLRWTLRTQ